MRPEMYVDTDWYKGEECVVHYPVVAENLMMVFLNDIYGFHVKAEHVLEAIEPMLPLVKIAEEMS